MYEVYCKIDLDCQLAHVDHPWLLPVMGDFARVSFRGKAITMCGVKQADASLPSQRMTGKNMNQSWHMYTPALAGYITPPGQMWTPWFVDPLVLILGMCVQNSLLCVIYNRRHINYVVKTIWIGIEELNGTVSKGCS